MDHNLLQLPNFVGEYNNIDLKLNERLFILLSKFKIDIFNYIHNIMKLM